jgi:hypothetical protein
MRRDRSEPMNLFALVSALSLALDPVLTEQDRVLHDDTLVQAVTADLIRRLPRTPIDGRPSTPRLVKKLMRPRTCSISGARRAVLDSKSGLYAFRLLLT